MSRLLGLIKSFIDYLRIFKSQEELQETINIEEDIVD
jgi:hypothetical protein